MSLYSGVKGDISYRQMARETGRKGENLKAWYGLHKKYPDFKEYEKIAEKKAQEWTDKVFKIGFIENKPETPTLPEGQFNDIYADTCWEYRNTGFDGSADKKYDTMSGEDITHSTKMK